MEDISRKITQSELQRDKEMESISNWKTEDKMRRSHISHQREIIQISRGKTSKTDERQDFYNSRITSNIKHNK